MKAMGFSIKQTKDEDFISVQEKYTEISRLENVWEHPVVRCVMSLLDVIPGFGTIIDESVKMLLKEFQKKKLERLFVCILEDSNVTVEKVSNITVLMEMARTIEVVMRLHCNDKIEYVIF